MESKRTGIAELCSFLEAPREDETRCTQNTSLTYGVGHEKSNRFVHSWEDAPLVLYRASRSTTAATLGECRGFQRWNGLASCDVFLPGLYASLVLLAPPRNRSSATDRSYAACHRSTCKPLTSIKDDGQANDTQFRGTHFAAKVAPSLTLKPARNLRLGPVQRATSFPDSVQG